VETSKGGGSIKSGQEHTRGKRKEAGGTEAGNKREKIDLLEKGYDLTLGESVQGQKRKRL